MSDANEFDIEEGDEFSTVYGDMITFVAVLFMLLFMMVYNETQDKTFFAKMNIKLGGEKVEQQEKASAKEVTVKSLATYITEEELSQYSMVIVNQAKVKLVVNDPILFKSGSAELDRSAIPILTSLSAIIQDVDNPIIIEGYSDTQEAKGKNAKENWVLSSERAYTVLRYFVDELDLEANRFSVQSFGATKPLKDNKSPQAREQNRRVELAIIRIF